MMSKKSPQLRFEGFTDDWEQRKLNEVSDIYDGTHQTPKYQDDGVMFLSVENIKTLTSNKFISREAFEDEFKIRPQRGDVLMTRIGDIGTANVVETDEDLAYYVSLALFKSEELNPYFLQASIYAPFVQDQIWKRTLHIAFPKKINKNAIGQVPINVPTLAEQTKIGSFFKQLDDTITLHQRKLDLLKEQKKGFLQKMFPKNGEKVPELRFAGFADDWEERKLGDIFKKDTQKNKDLEFHSDSVISVAKMKLSPPSAKSSDEYMKTYNKIRKGNVAFEGHTNDEFPNGRFVLNDCQDGIVSHIYDVYSAVDEYNNEFMKRYINNPDVMRKILINATSSARMMKSLNSIEFLKQSILLPILSEQQKIGSFFKQLDDTIALHQRKLDLLKEQKKGFLQKMFV